MENSAALPFRQIDTTKFAEYKTVGGLAIFSPDFPHNGSSTQVSLAVTQSEYVVVKAYSNDSKIADFKDKAFKEKLLDKLYCLGGQGALGSAGGIITGHNSYYYLPFYNCGTLESYMTGGRMLIMNESQLQHFIKDIVEQINSLHSLNNFHGEITPGHIMVNATSLGKYQYRLIGFGHTIPKSPDFYRTRPAMMAYLSEEVIGSKPKNPPSTYSDIWSLGVIIYQLATGQLPIIARTPDGEYSEINVSHPNVTEVLEHLLKKCLSVKPEDRGHITDIIKHPYFLPTYHSLEPYTLDLAKPLGSGASATVYKAIRNDRLGKFYAIKVLLPIEQLDPTIRSRILGEMYILSKLRDCPFVVGLEDVFKYNGKIHFVLQYCNGGDLENYHKIRDKLGKDALKIIVFSLASGLKELHRRKIMHRDIKTKNALLVLDANGKLIQALLADFGTSREYTDIAETISGTVGYIAPEVVSQQYTDAVDVWSFGVLLFYLRYGKLPKDVMQSHLHNIYKEKKVFKPPGWEKTANKEYEEVLDCCLAFDPATRPGFSDLLRLSYFKKLDFEKISPAEEQSFMPPLGNISSFHSVSVSIILDLPNNSYYKLFAFKGSVIKIVNPKAVNLLLLLNCENVLRMEKYYISNNGDYCLWIEHFGLNGELLKDYVVNSHVISMANIKAIAKGVANGLRELHRRGLVHGFLTKEAVTIDRNAAYDKINGVKIDYAYGIVRSANEGRLDDEKKLMEDMTEDIKSFGILLYYLLYKKDPELKKNERGKDSVVLPVESTTIDMQQARHLIGTCISPKTGKATIDNVMKHSFLS